MANRSHPPLLAKPATPPGPKNTPRPVGGVPRLLFAVVRPFRTFFRTQAAGGAVLIVATALAWAAVLLSLATIGYRLVRRR